MKKILLIAMMLVLTFSCLSMVKADVLPPTITLNVKVDQGRGPLPTYVTYTAKLSYMVPVISNAFAMNFYCNGVKIGRANIDPNTLIAVWRFTQNPGKYEAVAALDDVAQPAQPIKSNPVYYTVLPTF